MPNDPVVLCNKWQESGLDSRAEYAPEGGDLVSGRRSILTAALHSFAIVRTSVR